MARHIFLADLAAMTEAERDEELRALTRAASGERNGTATAMAAKVRQFELADEMSSAQMIAKLADGTLKETARIAEWLFLLEVLSCEPAK